MLALTTEEQRVLRPRFARGIGGMSPVAHDAVRKAIEDANGATPSTLVLSALALEHGVMARELIPAGFVL
jgi:hypothetical protein